MFATNEKIEFIGTDITDYKDKVYYKASFMIGATVLKMTVPKEDYDRLKTTPRLTKGTLTIDIREGKTGSYTVYQSFKQ